MSVESDLYDTLRLYAPLSALVALRIYPEAIAQDDALPAVVYSKTDSEAITLLDGTVALTRNRMAVQAFSRTRDEADTVIGHVIAALAARTPPVPVESRIGGFDDTVGLHAASAEFDIWV